MERQFFRSAANFLWILLEYKNQDHPEDALGIQIGELDVRTEMAMLCRALKSDTLSA